MPEPTHQPNLPDILLEAPTPPRRSGSFYASLVLAVLVLGWSIHGAKIRPGELLDGIPQIFLTLGRMFPPDFSKITESKNYFLPDTLSWRDLLVPLPLADEQARTRQRWWDNTFPQTVIGATLETVQMALAGTFLALLVAFPVIDAVVTVGPDHEQAGQRAEGRVEPPRPERRTVGGLVEGAEHEGQHVAVHDRQRDGPERRP